MEEQQESSVLGRYRTDLRGAVGSSASAYGYTLTIWSTGTMLSHFYGSQPPGGLIVPRGGSDGLRIGRGPGLRRRNETLWRRFGKSPAVGELPPLFGRAVGRGGLAGGCYGPSFWGWP